MTVDKIKITAVGDGLRLSGIDNFSPEKTFTCGQCFRWHEDLGGSFTGVAFGRVLNVSQSGNDIIIKNCTIKEYESIWKRYFDIERDYALIADKLSENEVLSEAVHCGGGIRILRQDFFECLISFIISANNNIPRIQGILNRFCEMFGDKLRYNGKVYYTFPKPEALKGITEADLAPLRSGYRARYLKNAIGDYLTGCINPEKIARQSVREARTELCKIMGVGPKVADCILLFSMGRLDTFPTDTWIKRVMCELYGCRESDAAHLGEKLFGENAGLAQQYLFYWRRAL